MHGSSMNHMRGLRDKYLAGREQQPLVVFDIGAQDVNPQPLNYRQIFESANWRYVGVDMAAGPNVDLVLADPYRWSAVEDGSVDVIVTGQAFEHIEFFWVTMEEMARVLKPEGLIFLIAPSTGPEHRYPVDCWRFYPDGMTALARWTALELLESWTMWDGGGYTDGSELFKDTVAVLKKPKRWEARVRTAAPMPRQGFFQRLFGT